MLFKGILGGLLILGLLQVNASGKDEKAAAFDGESSDLLKSVNRDVKQKNDFVKNHEYSKTSKEYNKDEKHHYEKDYKGKKEGKYKYEKDYQKDEKYQYQKDYKKDAKNQFEKDYKSWNKKMKHDYHHDDHYKGSSKEHKYENHEYVDKFNKYGKTFNPNYIDQSYKKHYKDNHHEKLSDKLEKQISLMHDTEVNYGSLHDKPKSLLHDMEVNYMNDHKKIDENSELINHRLLDSSKSKEKYEENYQNKNYVYDKRDKKNIYQNLKKIDISSPPVNDSVLLARYIVHSVDWAAVATLNSRSSPSNVSPFACVKSVSDGEINKSSGVPFFYLSSLDLCVEDLNKNDKISALMTLSETEYCKTKSYDPQDPRCAKVMLSGRLKWVRPHSEEEIFAQKALFTRHPIMETWPTDHNWKFAKIQIDDIILIRKFGGAEHINIKDYFNAKTLENSDEAESAMP